MWYVVMSYAIEYWRTTYLEVPPPICSPHLVDVTFFAVRIAEDTFGCKSKVLCKYWIPYDLFDTFHRITIPNLQLLD